MIDHNRIKAIAANHRAGNHNPTFELRYFLQVTADMPQILRAIGPEYKLVANDLSIMQSAMEHSINARQRMRNPYV